MRKAKTLAKISIDKEPTCGMGSKRDSIVLMETFRVIDSTKLDPPERNGNKIITKYKHLPQILKKMVTNVSSNPRSEPVRLPPNETTRILGISVSDKKG